MEHDCVRYLEHTRRHTQLQHTNHKGRTDWGLAHTHSQTLAAELCVELRTATEFERLHTSILSPLHTRTHTIPMHLVRPLLAYAMSYVAGVCPRP